MTRTEALSRLSTEIALRGYSDRTADNYMSSVKGFLSYVAKEPKQDPIEYIRSYQLRLQELELEARTINLCISAIKFFYEAILGKSVTTADVPRMKEPKTLPEIFGRDEQRMRNTGYYWP